MSVNRLLKRRQQQAQNMSLMNNSQSTTSGTQFMSEPIMSMTKQQGKLQQIFQQYADYAQYNPSGHQFSNTHMPYNGSLNNRFKLPLSIIVSPVSYDMDPVQKSIDKIPRCASCRGFMNYYNQVKTNSFLCFICGRQNTFMNNCQWNTDSIQTRYPSYHVLGGENVYLQSPPENAFIFLVDINVSSAQSRMLYYFVAAAKQILSKQQFDETQIFFYTYDDVLQQYDFSGDEVKCTVIDPSIDNLGNRVHDNFLSNIRDKLFSLLDNLQSIAQNNKKQASNFYKSFGYVFEATKHTGGKMFIFQSNDAIIGENFAQQNFKNPNNQVQQKPRSFLQSKNKQLFNQYIKQAIDVGMSFSFFIFQKKYKNIRVFGDFAKLTSSELLMYKTQNPQDLKKFYYDLSYLLGCTYYKDVRMQVITSSGWILAAVYGNCYRIKQDIIFKMCSIEQSKRLFINLVPQLNFQVPYFCFQTITNYIYNRQHFVCVNTSVLPLTTSLEKLYANQNYGIAAASFAKTALSNLRLEEINSLRNKFIKILGNAWKCATDFYKKNVSTQIINLMLHQLGVLKSQHFQLDGINQTQALDVVMSQRNILQSCSTNQLQCFFSPYLFSLSSMTEQMCRDEENFVYPPICELKFNSVKEGIYLLDNGLSLYLYISKVCDPSLLRMLYGKQKLGKHDNLSEENFMTNNIFARQVTTLIQVLREQKSWGWIPLYVVRCGQGSIVQKNFYMNFYAEKYDQFRGIKFTLPEFLHVLGSIQNEQY